MSFSLKCLEINPSSHPQLSIIWLHGLGATNNDFVSIVDELNIKEELPVRFIFPQAPVRPVTLNGGFSMPAWFDILGLDIDSQEDEQGIRLTERAINKLISQEVMQGIPVSKIMLAGFSQGGAMALHTGLRYPQALAGIIALSTYLPLRHHLAEEASPASQHTPIFFAHGSYDIVLPLSFAQMSQQWLANAGFTTEWHTYPMAHTVCPQEIMDLQKWLKTRME